MLRHIKCNQLKDEITAVEQECLKAVDRKNTVIRRLLCDLDESEELYSTMLHSHMQNLETLITLHRERVYFCKDWYKKERDLLLERYDEEVKAYKVKKSQAQKELECVFYALVEKAGEERKLSEEQHLQKKDSLKNSVRNKQKFNYLFEFNRNPVVTSN